MRIPSVVHLVGELGILSFPTLGPREGGVAMPRMRRRIGAPRRAGLAGALAGAVFVVASLVQQEAALAAPKPAPVQPTEAGAAAPTATPAPVPTPKPAHRPLRQNVPNAGLPEPTEPETFAGYKDARPFAVVPQKPGLTMFPCTQCHGPMPPNPVPRKLNAPHNSALDHGKGRLWCLSCHLVDDRDHLHTIRDEKVDFDDAYLVCGQCHSNRQKDWYLGGHGKRAVNWQGDRVLYNCTHCHDPHSPTIKPRKASPPPPVRAGLSPMKPAEERNARVWERYSANPQEAKP